MSDDPIDSTAQMPNEACKLAQPAKND